MLPEHLLFKLNHTLTTAIIFITIYTFGAFPNYFYILHSLKVFVYFLTRFYSWKQKKFHYYMFDFCYFANIIYVVISFVYPDNITLQKMIFVCANGPLATAVIILNNRIVYHSQDFTVSSFIHMSPMLLSYITRWNTQFSDHKEIISFENYGYQIFLAIILYICWFVPYYILLYGILYHRTIEKNNITMFDYAVSSSFTFIKNITQKRRLQQFIYSIFHFICFFIASLISPLFWYYKELHFAYIILITIIAIWNGSNYYYYKINSKENKEKQE